MILFQLVSFNLNSIKPPSFFCPQMVNTRYNDVRPAAPALVEESAQRGRDRCRGIGRSRTGGPGRVASFVNEEQINNVTINENLIRIMRIYRLKWLRNRREKEMPAENAVVSPFFHC